jgi:3-oxoacid CoA-transferase B subunit
MFDFGLLWELFMINLFSGYASIAGRRHCKLHDSGQACEGHVI